jgi:hypothetical protein
VEDMGNESILERTFSQSTLRHRKISAILSIVVTSLTFCKILFPNTNLSGFDKIAYSGPNFASVIDQISQGAYPLWNSTQFLGSPLIGNTQAGAIYPFKVLGLFTEIRNAIDILTFIHILILVIGLWILIEVNLQLTPFSGAIGVFVLIGTSAFTYKVGQFEQILVLAWVPWVLVGIDNCLRRKRRMIHVVLLASYLSLFVTAGHPQMVIFSVPLFVAWAIGRSIDIESSRRFADLAVSAVLAVAITAPQLVSTFFTAAQMADPDRNFESYRVFSLNPQSAPYELLSFPTSGSVQLPPATFESSLGLSTFASLFLILVPFLVWKTRVNLATVSALSTVTLFALMLSLGAYLPFFRFALDHVPGFAFSRVPGRWLIFVAIGASILVAFSFDALLSNKNFSSMQPITGTFLFLGLFAIILVIGPSYRNTSIAATTILTAIILLLFIQLRAISPNTIVSATLVVFLVGVYATASKSTLVYESIDTSASTQIPDFLRENPGPVLSLAEDRLPDYQYLRTTLRPNANSTYLIQSVDGYDGGLLVSKNWVAAGQTLMNGAFNIDLTMRSQIDRPVVADKLAELGVRWVLIDTNNLTSELQVSGFGEPLFEQNGIQIYENPSWMGVLVSLPVQDMNQDEFSSSVNAYKYEARFNRYSSTITLDAGSKIVLAQRFDPGWRAKVDGEPTQVVAHNNFLVSIVVPPGKHEIEIYYYPTWFNTAMFIQLVAIFFSLLLLVKELRVAHLAMMASLKTHRLK